MAARNDTIPCPEGVPTKISDGAVANARVQGSKHFTLLATAADTAPEDVSGGVQMEPFTVLTGDIDLSDLFLGVTGPYYLWAWPTLGAVNVSISHA